MHGLRISGAPSMQNLEQKLELRQPTVLYRMKSIKRVSNVVLWIKISNPHQRAGLFTKMGHLCRFLLLHIITRKWLFYVTTAWAC